MDLLLGGGGAEAVTLGFLHREGAIGGDTSHNALKWVPNVYNSFDHFPYLAIRRKKAARISLLDDCY